MTRIHFTLHEYRYTFMIISRLILLRMRNISEKIYRENHDTHFIFYNVFRKSCPLWDNVEKYFTAGQTIQTKMAHAHYMATNAESGCCNTYCFSTAILVAWRRFNVTLQYIASLAYLSIRNTYIGQCSSIFHWILFLNCESQNRPQLLSQLCHLTIRITIRNAETRRPAKEHKTNHETDFRFLLHS
jgi:hypothetical protein